jgi:hypothetical protein
MRNPKKPESANTFFASMLEELMAMPDDEVLEGEEPKKVLARRDAALQAAKKAAGQKRMAAAKTQLAAHKIEEGAGQPIDAKRAREYISQVANDPRYTLAARNATGLTGEEAVALYLRIKAMEKAAEDKKNGDGS